MDSKVFLEKKNSVDVFDSVCLSFISSHSCNATIAKSKVRHVFGLREQVGCSHPRPIGL